MQFDFCDDNKNKSINMFNELPEISGIKLKVDRIDKCRTGKNDIVMPLFYEEQPLMWNLFQYEIKDTIKFADGEVDFMDVGTGSGFWAIITAKHSRKEKSIIIGIDKIMKCIEIARENSVNNDVRVELRHEKYSFSSAPLKSVKAITLTPPYHLYPPELEFFVPNHARGGSSGLEEFISQLTIASSHIARDGRIFFNHMSLSQGRSLEEAESVKFIIKLFPNASIMIYKIFPPIGTLEFLNRVYGTDYMEWQKSTAMDFPYIYYFDGFIKIDCKSRFEIVEVKDMELCGTSWDDRIILHREIYKHAKGRQE